MERFGRNGETLGSYLEKSSELEEIYAQYLFKQLIDALTVLFESSVLHTNITPFNILLKTNNFSIKIIGFEDAQNISNG